MPTGSGFGSGRGSGGEIDALALRFLHQNDPGHQTAVVPPPARFEHSVKDARRLARGFAAFYWALVALLAVGAVWRRGLLVAAVVFALVVAIWQRQIGRVPLRPWVLTVDTDELRVGDVVVRRSDTAEVRFVRRWTRGAAWSELQVRDHAGQRVLREGVRDDHRAGIEDALYERGWPVRNRSGGR